MNLRLVCPAIEAKRKIVFKGAANYAKIKPLASNLDTNRKDVDNGNHN